LAATLETHSAKMVTYVFLAVDNLSSCVAALFIITAALHARLRLATRTNWTLTESQKHLTHRQRVLGLKLKQVWKG